MTKIRGKYWKRLLPHPTIQELAHDPKTRDATLATLKDLATNFEDSAYRPIYGEIYARALADG